MNTNSSNNISSIERLEFYSFFSKFSYLDNYGFLAGLTKRIFRKLIPNVPSESSFQYLIKDEQLLQKDTITTKISNLLKDPATRSSISENLDRSIVSLITKTVSLGLDHEFYKIFKILGINSDCYEDLAYKSNQLFMNGGVAIKDLQSSLREVENTVIELRNKKNKIGTSLHLTVLTKRLLDHISHIDKLLALKLNIEDMGNWDMLIKDHVVYEKETNSLWKYIGVHFDLLALEIVDHTSNQGEKYTADSRSEYWSFFRKGLIGGAVIALFALFKISVDNYDLTAIPLAIIYSINYATCFLIVKFLGGTIATKQPALTTSTIIKHIDKTNNLRLDGVQDAIILIRKVIRSQFISLIGNFTMALILSIIIGYALKIGFLSNPIDDKKSLYLLKQVSPIEGGAIFYATIAGIFLALSGLISGYFDNKVLASRLPHRIIHNKKLSSIMNKQNRTKVASFIKKNFGILMGNISLGIFLGSAFLLSYILPFAIDIRHIAFSTANVGYSFVNHSTTPLIISIALLSVLIIGFTNFFVSFSITFFIALKSRSITGRELGTLMKSTIKDMVMNPLEYLVHKQAKNLKLANR